MNLLDFDSVEEHEAGARYQLLSQTTGEPTDAFITIKGVDSIAWEEGQKKQRAKYLDEDVDMFSHKFIAPIIAGCIVSWENVLKGKEELECTPENALWLCENYKQVTTQLFQFLLDRKNFTKG